MTLSPSGGRKSARGSKHSAAVRPVSGATTRTPPKGDAVFCWRYDKNQPTYGLDRILYWGYTDSDKATAVALQDHITVILRPKGE